MNIRLSTQKPILPYLLKRIHTTTQIFLTTLAKSLRKAFLNELSEVEDDFNNTRLLTMFDASRLHFL